MTEKQEALLKAIDAVNKGATISAASRQYKIPRSTLDDKVRCRYAIGCSKGPATVLSKEEEEHLKNWIIFMADRGFPVSKAQLLDSVSLLMKTMKRDNPFQNGRPGRHWFEAFLKRNPEVGQRVAQNLTQSRALVQEIYIRQWFKEIEDYFMKAHLEEAAQDPRRIFNCDESAFFLSPADNRVLAKRGAKNIYNVIPSGERECVTVLITANAAGELAPPMVLFKLKSIPHKISKNAPKDWGLGFTQKGWMTGESFYEYMANVFFPWLERSNIQRPIIFFLDGHCSHTTLPLSNFCREKSIQLIALYPNATHLLQPMDVAVFRPLKRIWKKTVYDWRNENIFLKLKKENFCPLLHTTLNQLDPNSIQNGFIKCGLSPFDANSVDYSKCVLSNRTHTTAPSNIGQKETDSVEHFQYFESQISPENLKSFYENNSTTWKGDRSLKGLFDVWRQMKPKKISDDFNNGPSSQAQMSGQGDINEYDISVGNFTGLTGTLGSKFFNSNEFSGLISENHSENVEKIEVYENLNGTLNKIMDLKVPAKQPVPSDAFSFESETHNIPIFLAQDLQNVASEPVLVELCNNVLMNTEKATPNPIQIHSNDELMNLMKKDKTSPEKENQKRIKYSGPVIRTVGSDPIYFTTCRNIRSSTGNTTLPPSAPACLDFAVELMQTETQTLPNTELTSHLSEKTAHITPPDNKSQKVMKIKTISPMAGTSTNYVQSETTPPNEPKAQQPPINNVEQTKTKYYGDLEVPTPFKNALFWPETPSCSTKSKFKLPSVITSERWQIFSQKKEDAKKIKENNKNKVKDKKLKKSKPRSGDKKSKNRLADTGTVDITNENWYCRLCQRCEKLEMIQCVTCKTWYHTICAKVLPDQISFNCSYCNSLDE